VNTLTTPSARTRSTQPRLADLDGVRLGVAHVVLALALLSATAIALPGRADLALVALMAVVGGFELPLGFAALFGFSCWACYTGFIENRLGQLTLLAPDLQRLAALVVVAVAGSLLHRIGRRG
jgi:hypothetical protein